MPSLIGVPFKDGGRDYDGADCWGIVRLAFAQVGIDLPSYGEIGAEELLRIAKRITTETKNGTWREVPSNALQKLDVVTMRQIDGASSVPIHVGVMMGRKRMLHTMSTAGGSHMIAVDHIMVCNRITGYYRHKELA